MRSPTKCCTPDEFRFRKPPAVLRWHAAEVLLEERVN